MTKHVPTLALSAGSTPASEFVMAYIYRQIEGGIGQEQSDALLQAVREIEVEGSPTDLIGVRFRHKGDGISPSDIGRAENWRDLPVQERTALYWREGKEVRPASISREAASQANAAFLRPCSYWGAV